MRPSKTFFYNIFMRYFANKKYFFVFLISVLTVTTATAQGNMAQRAAQLGKFPARRSVTRTLKNRVQRTYLDAQIARCALLPADEWSSFIVFSSPANRMKPQLHVAPQELYPQAPFLVTRKQVSDYFLSLNNREIVPFLKVQQQYRKNIQQHLDDFKKGRRSILEGAEMRWVASQIPDKTSLLLLGETHTVDDIKLNIIQLLQELRNKYPNRPMLLFTEFLPQGTVFGKNTWAQSLPTYAPVWAIAHNLDIPTLGLEPTFVSKNDNCEMGPKHSLRENIWTSYEGMRLRNTHWVSFIKDFQQQMRQAHPELDDILIIVYSGAGHTQYGMPYSVADMFPEEKIFSVSFYPTYLESNNMRTYETSPFDKYSNGLFAKDKALLFKDKKLANLLGSNIRIKVEPIHQIAEIGLIVPNNLNAIYFKDK